MKKAFLFVLFGIISALFSQSTPVFAASVIESFSTKASDTWIDFEIRITKGYALGVNVSCTDPSKKTTYATGIKSKEVDGAFTARCTSLLPETTYTYAIYASDGTSFPTRTDSTKTLSKSDLVVKPEVYKLENPTVITQEGGKYITASKVSITNPVELVGYRLALGKPNNKKCTFLPEYRAEQRPDVASLENKFLIINGSWTLSEGTYCLGIEKETGAVLREFVTAVEVLETFTVGGKTIPPGVPNEYGCTANSTEEYCALAPLPGIGEVDEQGNQTGKISLTECYIDGVKVDEPGFGCYLNNILKLVMGIIIILSVIFIIIGGIEAMASQNGEKKVSWKGRVRGAVLGLILALSSFLILNTLNDKLVKLGVTLPSVTLDLKPDAPPTRTYVSTSLNGTPVKVLDALCNQVSGTVPVKVRVGANMVPQEFKMPIISNSVWPSDSGKITTVTAASIGLIDSKFEGQPLSIIPGNERTRLEQAGVDVKEPESLTAGSSGTTSVYGLPEAAIQGLIRLKKACNCEVVVTGGTECWAHRSHGPGLQPVDLRKTDSLKAFIYDKNNTKKSGSDYIWGSTIIFDEDSAHFHVRSW